MFSFQDLRITCWAVGLMVGAGIYSLIGDIVKASGDHAPKMFVVASLVMLLNAFVLAGTVRRFPRAGSILAVVKACTHPWVATAFEVLRLVEGGLALCVTSKLTARFLSALVMDPSVSVPMSAGLELATLFAIAVIVHMGFESAADFGNAGTLVEVSGLVLVIVSALMVPAVPVTTVPHELTMQKATLSVTQIVFAFGGVQGVLDVAGDVEDAEHALPKALLLSVAITGFLYTCVCSAALSMVGVEKLTQQAISPLGMVLEIVGFPIGTETALAVVSLMSIGNTCMGIFTFVSRIAISLCRHMFGELGVRPQATFTAMVLLAWLVGQNCDVFRLAAHVGVMLLITFLVLDYTFLAAIAETSHEKIIGSLAFVSSCGLVVVDRCLS